MVCQAPDPCAAASGGDAGSAAAGSGAGGSGSGGLAGASGNAGAAGDVGAGGSGGAAGEGGAAAEGGSAGSGDSCDRGSDPFASPCLINEEYAVFISPLGSDAGGTGTRERPYASFERGLRAAHATKKQLYACATEGEYAEALYVGPDLDGMTIVGAFDCTEWRADVALRAVLHPAAGGALRVEELKVGLELRNLRFQANSAQNKGGSSVAAWVRDSKAVEFRSISLLAGRGSNGADGALVPFMLEATALAGQDSVADAGGAARACMCPAGDSSLGAAGGNATPEPTGGETGMPPLGGGAGGQAAKQSPEECSVGEPGLAAVSLPEGASATLPGTLLNGVWQPTPGNNGAAGPVGQGGGGGGADYRGVGGGGGGCGGCGGAGGPGGKGGGASIGLISVNSRVKLDDVAITTSAAGGGGRGASGQQQAQQGGAAGKAAAYGCNGGGGGAGAFGASGGGGAGGVSVGILWDGAANDEPTTIGLLFDLGAAGPGGKSGSSVSVGVSGVQAAMSKVTSL